MAKFGKRVFLSYRRDVSWTLAEAVRRELVSHGFDVFVDTRNLNSGEFEGVICRQIEKRAHFLLLLERRSLDRIGDDGDWLHREIAHALASRRNVVPMLVDGARMPASADLPADIAQLPSCSAVSLPQEYFDEAMQRLRERFLRPPRLASVVNVGHKLRGDLGLAAPVVTVVDTAPLAVQLTWLQVDGAADYEVQQSLNDQFRRSCRVSTVRTLQRLVVLRVELKRGHWFRVRARGAGMWTGPWSRPVRVRG